MISLTQEREAILHPKGHLITLTKIIGKSIPQARNVSHVVDLKAWTELQVLAPNKTLSNNTELPLTNMLKR
jgi:hypothetical protein